MEEILKDKNEAKESVKKNLKVEDEAEGITQNTQELSKNYTRKFKKSP
jgi:hypothetical protein